MYTRGDPSEFTVDAGEMSIPAVVDGVPNAQETPNYTDTPLCTVDTEHGGQIHDCQVDHFGKRVATCSSDATIKILSLENNNLRHLTTLKGHKGPVWQVRWAFPSFGTLLASCSFEGTVKIWKNEGDVWWVVWENISHAVSGKNTSGQKKVNSIAWAPPEYDLMLASVCSDGKVCISRCKGKTWDVDSFYAHKTACYSVAWAPSKTTSRRFSPKSQSYNSKLILATGGCDSLIKLWENVNGQWVNKSVLKGHKGWIRDLNFSPSTGSDITYLASCSDDKSVLIWKKHDLDDNWNMVNLNPELFSDTVWRVSWSFSGNMLSVSYGESYVSIWKETLDGSWIKIQNNC